MSPAAPPAVENPNSTDGAAALEFGGFPGCSHITSDTNICTVYWSGNYQLKKKMTKYWQVAVSQLRRPHYSEWQLKTWCLVYGHVWWGIINKWIEHLLIILIVIICILFFCPDFNLILSMTDCKKSYNKLHLLYDLLFVIMLWINGWKGKRHKRKSWRSVTMATWLGIKEAEVR